MTSFSGPRATRPRTTPRRTLPCQDNPALFFAESPQMLQAAKGLCAECPIKTTCLSAALERREPHGVWGGEVFVDGRVVASKRGRGRPRKSQPAA